MSRADSWRAARVADALLQSLSVFTSCRHRRWRVIALAQWNLGLAELEVDRGRWRDELRDHLDDRPISRAIAGDLDPDLTFVDRLEAVVALASSRRGLERTALLLSVGSDEVRRAHLAALPRGVAARLRACLETGELSFPGTPRPSRFIGALARSGSADHYPASVALAVACARRCLVADRPDLLRRVDAIAAAIGEAAIGARALAHYGAGDSGAALGIAASIGSRSRRDRALLDLAAAALGRGDDRALARFTRALEGARAGATGAMLRGLGALRRRRLGAARRELGRVSFRGLAARRDQLLAVCDLARTTGTAIPWPADLPADPTTVGPALALLLRVGRGLRRRDLTAAVELQRNPLVVDPRWLPAIAAAARGFEPRRVLTLAHVAGGLRARAAWAAALLGDRLRLAWHARGSSPPGRLEDLRAALGGAPRPADPIGRATHDEVLALAHQVRSPVAFCRAAVRAAGGSLALVESRARALALLGGGHAISALHKIIDRCRHLPRAVSAALRALLVIDPRGAVDHLLAAARADVMTEAEATGLIEAGFAETWCAIWDRTERRDRSGHLLRAVDDWRSRHGRLPPRCLLIPLADEVLETDPPTWSAAVEAALRDGGPPGAVAASLAGDPGLLFKAVWTRSPVLPARSPVWNDVSYRRAIAALRTPAVGTPRPGTVVRFARLAGGRPRASALARALLAGSSPGAMAVRSLGKRRRLRLLDKRKDLLEHLRFADVVGCCFTSSSVYYSCECHSTRTNVYRLWRDPLSFVFVIEEARSRRWELRGFVFGGFGVAAGAPVALLNGIYAQVQTRDRRRAILEALEDHFASIGVHRLAVANEHAGHGWLPGNYDRAPLRVERLRALVDPTGKLLGDVYDDIGGPANEPSTFSHLHWSPRLRRSASR